MRVRHELLYAVVLDKQVAGSSRRPGLLAAATHELLLDLVKASGVPAARFFCAFGVALPLFVYAFLSGGWVTRLSIGLLR